MQANVGAQGIPLPHMQLFNVSRLLPPSSILLLRDHAGLRCGPVLHLRPSNDHVLNGRYSAHASAPTGVLLRGQSQPGTNGPNKIVDFRSGKSQVRFARDNQIPPSRDGMPVAIPCGFQQATEGAESAVLALTAWASARRGCRIKGSTSVAFFICSMGWIRCTSYQPPPLLLRLRRVVGHSPCSC